MNDLSSISKVFGKAGVKNASSASISEAEIRCEIPVLAIFPPGAILSMHTGSLQPYEVSSCLRRHDVIFWSRLGSGLRSMVRGRMHMNR